MIRNIEFYDLKHFLQTQKVKMSTKTLETITKITEKMNLKKTG